MPATRTLIPGVHEVLAFAMADHQNGLLSDAQMNALDPNWKSKMLVTGQPVYGPNLVVNGSFDTSVAGWTNQTPAWISLNAATDLGRPCMYFNIGPSALANGSQAGVSQLVSVPAGQRGRKAQLTASFRTVGGQANLGKIWAVLYSLPGYATVTGVDAGHLSQADGWVTLTAEGVIPMDSVQLEVYLLYIADTGQAIAAGGAFPEFTGVSVRIEGGVGDYKATMLATKPLSYWRFGETSGTVATDEMGLKHGTYLGTPTLGAAGLVSGADKCVQLPGVTNTMVSVGARPEYSVAYTGELSLGCVINPANTGRMQLAMRSGDLGGVKYEYGWNIIANSMAWEHWLPDGSLNNVTSYIAPVIPTGVVHLGVSISLAQQMVWFFVNGVEITGGNKAVTWTSTPTGPLNLPLDIGQFFTGSYAFNGKMDEYAIWGRRLAATEWAALYSARGG